MSAPLVGVSNSVRPAPVWYARTVACLDKPTKSASGTKTGSVSTAWPLTLGRTGTATYFVNQTGEILVAKSATYDGTTSVPPPGAALTGVAPATIVGGQIAAGTTGADGNLWQLIR